LSNLDLSYLSKTRAEEQPDDVTDTFIVPPYFSKLGLQSSTKSVLITGKRGCGKTMLLKFLDYRTAFSRARKDISASEVEHIAIYWRVDTHFCGLMRERDIDDIEWRNVFLGYFAICVSIDVLNAIECAALSECSALSAEKWQALELRSVRDFDPDYPSNAKTLREYLLGIRRQFSSWLSNVKKRSQPLLPPGFDFVSDLIREIARETQLPQLGVYVYVDEAESLWPNLQRVLNTTIKHSARPLIVNLVTKLAPKETRTMTEESINSTHDYRPIALDTLLPDGAREVFFAEIFLANYAKAIRRVSHDAELLTSVNRIEERNETAYQNRVLTKARGIFPDLTLRQIVDDIFVGEGGLKKEALDRVRAALHSRGESKRFDELVSAIGDQPDLMIIAPALLYRGTPFSSLVATLSSRGQTTQDLLHNNLFGALLDFYRPYGRFCPLYAGFETFCSLANGNLRHFLILCYRTFELADLKQESLDPVSIKTQAEAAAIASEQLLQEIGTFAPRAIQLRTFTQRLGALFRQLQAQAPMSEPEQNQFSINKGQRSLSDDEIDFIAEAKKHFILIENNETKTKTKARSDLVDYQLNPIYAPHFYISYRRKRKISLSVEQFHAIALGTADEFNKLERVFVKSSAKSNSGTAQFEFDAL
jgi:hypothetical protein